MEAPRHPEVDKMKAKQKTRFASLMAAVLVSGALALGAVPAGADGGFDTQEAHLMSSFSWGQAASAGYVMLDSLVF